ncbi:MAG: hypothetical protein AAFZ46_02740 [Pseudomonadota bacterium]
MFLPLSNSQNLLLDKTGMCRKDGFCLWSAATCAFLCLSEAYEYVAKLV